MLRRLRRWLLTLWRGWEYQKVNGTWIRVASRPLTSRRWEAARIAAARDLPVMNAAAALFRDTKRGVVTFSEMAEKLGQQMEDGRRSKMTDQTEELEQLRAVLQSAITHVAWMMSKDGIPANERTVEQQRFIDDVLDSGLVEGPDRIARRA